MKAHHEEMKKDAKMIFESDLRYEHVYAYLEKWHLQGQKAWADKDRPKR